MRRLSALWLLLLAVAAGTLVIPVADAASFFSPAGRPLPAWIAPDAPTAQAQPAITVQGYRERLQAAARSLSTQRESDAWNVVVTLRQMDVVQMPDATEVAPNLSVVIAALEAHPPDFIAAESALRAVLNELSRTAQPAGLPGGGEVHDRVTEILGRPEFNSKPTENPVAQQIARLREAILEWLGAVLRPIIVMAAERDLTPLWVAMGLALVGGIMLLTVRELRRTLGPDVAFLAPQRGARALDAESARAEAEELARLGDFRGAVRALYVAVLLRWDELGRLRFNRALTNLEVLDSVGSAGNGEAAAKLLAPLVERFDRFWYGAVPCSADDYAEFYRLTTSAWEAK